MSTPHITKTGRKTYKKGVTTTSRREQVKQLYTDLEDWKNTHSPEELAKIIAQATADFDGYSERNALLISMQRPDATDVDAYGAWKERGRTPMGHHGIKITAPGSRWYDDGHDGEEDHQHINFLIEYVFDVTNTIPDTPEARKAWTAAHPKADDGYRYWQPGEDYRDYDKYDAAANAS